MDEGVCAGSMSSMSAWANTTKRGRTFEEGRLAFEVLDRPNNVELPEG